MKIKAMLILTMAGIAAVNAQAEAIRSQAEWNLTVYLDGASLAPRGDMWMAQAIANKMFASAGVRTIWRSGSPPNAQLERECAVAVRFGAQTSVVAQSDVIAFALPYETFHISILYSRLSWLDGQPRLRPTFLAHVLVHEITHILQGVSRHSPSGVMKAVWNTTDYPKMTYEPLPFTSDDVVLIQEGLANRTERARRSTVASVLTAAAH
jgi:hypothetical protein